MQSAIPPQRRVLVVGGGPSGSATAYWLAKAGFDVDVVERSTAKPYGQGVDITDEAVQVVRSMGLLDTIKSNTTGETGFALLDDDANEIACLGTCPSEDGRVGVGSPTQEIEIMRGTLTEILVAAAEKEGAQYTYGRTITELEEREDSVTATFSNDGLKRDYLAVVGADGVASQVRKLAWPKSANEDCFNQTDTCVAYFSMDVPPEQRASYSRLQHADRGRCIWLRPINNDGSRASCYFIATSGDNHDLMQAARHGDKDEQKAVLEAYYQGVGGLRETAVRAMKACDDFYFTRVIQVRLDDWHVGRCALVGDSGYCPSPLTGQGTTMALLGAYMIAGELAANPTNPAAAFTEYKRKFEVFVKEEGNIPLGGRAPKLFLPQSSFGVGVVRSIICAVAHPTTQWLSSFLPSMPTHLLGGGKKFKLPRYEFQVR